MWHKFYVKYSKYYNTSPPSPLLIFKPYIGPRALNIEFLPERSRHASRRGCYCQPRRICLHSCKLVVCPQNLWVFRFAPHFMYFVIAVHTLRGIALFCCHHCCCWCSVFVMLFFNLSLFFFKRRHFSLSIFRIEPNGRFNSNSTVHGGPGTCKVCQYVMLLLLLL